METFTATDSSGRTHEAPNPNEAGAQALEASHNRFGDALVCVRKFTDQNNPYVVPVGWFSREMKRSWRKANPRT